MVKVSELESAELDYWVACAVGLNVSAIGCGLVKGFPQQMPRERWFVRVSDGALYYDFAPSSNWEQGGPLIESQFVRLEPWLWCSETGEIKQWVGGVRRPTSSPKPMYGIGRGNTALIAAMRAIVASAYGEYV